MLMIYSVSWYSCFSFHNYRGIKVVRRSTIFGKRCVVLHICNIWSMAYVMMLGDLQLVEMNTYLPTNSFLFNHYRGIRDRIGGPSGNHFPPGRWEVYITIHFLLSSFFKYVKYSDLSSNQNINLHLFKSEIFNDNLWAKKIHNIYIELDLSKIKKM